jgi:hypothetical protein
MTDTEVIYCWAMIEALRKNEGASVTVYCDNPDPTNREDQCKVSVSDERSGWEGQDYIGSTVMVALEKAVLAKTNAEAKGI